MIGLLTSETRAQRRSVLGVGDVSRSMRRRSAATRVSLRRASGMPRRSWTRARPIARAVRNIAASFEIAAGCCDVRRVRRAPGPQPWRAKAMLRGKWREKSGRFSRRPRWSRSGRRILHVGRRHRATQDRGIGEAHPTIGPFDDAELVVKVLEHLANRADAGEPSLGDLDDAGGWLKA